MSTKALPEYKARIEGSGDIHSIILYFRDINIISAANTVQNIAHTLGFSTDDVKQLIEQEGIPKL